MNDEKNFDDSRFQFEDGEKEEEVEVEKVVKEVVEEMLEVDEREDELPTTNEKFISLFNQSQESKMINLSDPSKDTYPEKEDTKSVINSTTLSKKEELVTLLDKYNKGVGWMIVVIKGLSPLWFPRKKSKKFTELESPNIQRITNCRCQVESTT